MVHQFQEWCYHSPGLTPHCCPLILPVWVQDVSLEKYNESFHEETLHGVLPHALPVSGVQYHSYAFTVDIGDALSSSYLYSGCRNCCSVVAFEQHGIAKSID